jgi:hypothetical protein
VALPYRGLIPRHWKFAPAIVGAVLAPQRPGLETDGADRLIEVLITSLATVPCVLRRKLPDEVGSTVRLFGRLSLHASDGQPFGGATAEQVGSLQAALPDGRLRSPACGAPPDRRACLLDSATGL